MGKAVIIGGGINGLSAAYYLQQSGWQVTVVDKEDFANNCSFGNMGYICPSHFVPLASPGIIKQGIKWMFNPESPFYIKPRLDLGLIQWGLKFMRSATLENLERSAVPLRDIALLSKTLYEDWLHLPGFDVAYQRKGLLELFQTAEKEEHAHHTAEDAQKLGLDALMLNASEVQAMEPQTRLNIKGALYFKCDAHLEPNRVMTAMYALLQQKGVVFEANRPVTGFEKKGNKISAVLSASNKWEADLVVIAAGSWSRKLASYAGLNLPLVGGRGYSFNVEHGSFILNHPAVLMEGRVALTPFTPNRIRIGGTMEITNLNAPPNYQRVKGIVKATRDYFPEAHFPDPEVKDIWYGFRPCSADGMPYIGRTKSFQNCIIATGHAMIGMSLGAATGKLVSELANEISPSVDLGPYNVHRFD